MYWGSLETLDTYLKIPVPDDLCVWSCRATKRSTDLISPSIMFSQLLADSSARQRKTFFQA